MSDLYQPGMAFAFGYAWHDTGSQTTQYVADLQRMRDQLEELDGIAFDQEVRKLAAAEVLQRIVAELKPNAAGQMPVRQLSDPRNAEGRNTVYAEAIAKQAKHLSAGEVVLSPASVDRLKRARTFK